MATQETTQEALEQELERLLDQETFEPPEDFREAALWNDPSIYEKANADPQAWWAEQAKALHWFSEPSEILDDSDPPFYKWFKDGTINASYNCLDRHVEAGLGDRVAVHRRGGGGGGGDITYARPHPDVPRLAHAPKDQGGRQGGGVGVFPPIIPEGGG